MKFLERDERFNKKNLEQTAEFTDNMAKLMSMKLGASVFKLPNLTPKHDDSPKQDREKKKTPSKSIIHTEAENPILIHGGDDDNEEIGLSEDLENINI